MKYIYLSSSFHIDYPQTIYPEIERKIDRPYILIYVNINNYNFAIPMRSHINHKFAYITDKMNKCGVDFSKTVYIKDIKYINQIDKPQIRQNEFNFLKGKDNIIKKKLLRYIKEYVEARNSQDLNRLKHFQFSTLKYFEDDVDYEKIVENNFPKYKIKSVI